MKGFTGDFDVELMCLQSRNLKFHRFVPISIGNKTMLLILGYIENSLFITTPKQYS